MPANSRFSGPVTATFYAGPVTATFYAGPVTATFYAGPVTATFYAGPVTATFYAGPVTATFYAGPFNDNSFTCQCQQTKQTKKETKSLRCKFRTFIGRFQMTSWQ